jgi:hypothetical protein
MESGEYPLSLSQRAPAGLEGLYRRRRSGGAGASGAALPAENQSFALVCSEGFRLFCKNNPTAVSDSVNSFSSFSRRYQKIAP